MRKHITIAVVIILTVAAIITAAVLLSRNPATGTHSLSNDGQGVNAAGEASGSNNGQGTGAVGQEAAGGDSAAAAGETGGQKQINIFTSDKELEVIVRQYAKMHPEFNYNIVCHENDNDFFYDLNHSLQNHDGKVDLYCVPATYAQWYVKGGYSGYACTYKDLGIDLETALKKAEIPQSIIDTGTRPDGELIALPYKKNVNLFMYRRSIARDIWGTDDPDKIADIIGAGTGKWDKFLKAAKTVKKHGAYMLANPLELADLVATDIPSGLSSDGNYDIDPKWEEFMDVTKSLLDNGCSQSITLWSDEYIKALDRTGTVAGKGAGTGAGAGIDKGTGTGDGDKPVFGFFTNDQNHRALSNLFKNTAGDWAVCLPPISVDTGFYTGFEDMDYYTGIMVNKNSPNKDALGPLIEWITLDCSETGLQHSLANDTFYTRIGADESVKYGGKRAVVSGTVMKNTINSDSFLDGQNINSVIHNAHQAPTGKHNATGIGLFTDWYYETDAYLRGEKDKKSAVADYKQLAREDESSIRDSYKRDGFTWSADGGLYSLLGTRELNVYSYDDELSELIKQYAQRHPEFNYKVNWYHYALIDDFCTLGAIDDNIQSDSPEVVDIYCVPDVYSHEIIKGEYSKHACTYKELGIDVDAALKKADIPQYIIDAGTNPGGEVIALPYMTGANVFMYRRSVAKDVWGTDDPDKIAGIIGSGTNKWDRFLEAAQTLKEHGCYIVPGFWDVSAMIDTGLAASAAEPDKGYDINPKWQEFMDVSKKMHDKDYIKETQYWSEEWIKALNGKGDKPVFGIVIPYNVFGFLSKSDKYLKSTAGDWAICVPPINTSAGFYTGILVNKDSPNKDVLGPLIKWLTMDCSETGLQYSLANDTLIDKDSQQYEFYGGKWPVISGTILNNTDCSLDFLGGQDINPVIYDALNTPSGKHNTFGIESSLFSLWLDETRAYLAGEKDRGTAVADYKKAEKEAISGYKKIFEEYGISFLLP